MRCASYTTESCHMSAYLLNMRYNLKSHEELHLPLRNSVFMTMFRRLPFQHVMEPVRPQTLKASPAISPSPAPPCPLSLARQPSRGVEHGARLQFPPLRPWKYSSLTHGPPFSCPFTFVSSGAQNATRAHGQSIALATAPRILHWFSVDHLMLPIFP